MQECESGRLDAVIVQPAGLIAPYARNDTHLMQFVAEVCSENLPANVNAGYNFVDVRDVSAGVFSRCAKGKTGNTYFLSGCCSMKKSAVQVKRTALLRL